MTVRQGLLLLAACLSIPALVTLGCIGVGYEARAPENPLAWKVTVLESQVATLQAELYRAELERCPNLGTTPAVSRRSR